MKSLKMALFITALLPAISFGFDTRSYNMGRLDELKSQREAMTRQDASLIEAVDRIDAEIAELEQESSQLDDSISERQSKLDSFLTKIRFKK